MSNRFTATYDIHQYRDGEEDIGHELLQLSVLFEHPLEEDCMIDEYTPTYETVTHEILKDYPEGVYRVFVTGKLIYTVDYYGEHDVEDEIEYFSVFVYPEEMAESMFGEDYELGSNLVYWVM